MTSLGLLLVISQGCLEQVGPLLGQHHPLLLKIWQHSRMNYSHSPLHRHLLIISMMEHNILQGQPASMMEVYLHSSTMLPKPWVGRTAWQNQLSNSWRVHMKLHQKLAKCRNLSNCLIRLLPCGLHNMISLRHPCTLNSSLFSIPTRRHSPHRIPSHKHRHCSLNLSHFSNRTCSPSPSCHSNPSCSP